MNRQLDWNDQRAFLAVLEEGSLSGAARRMGVSQPTIRARIAALEAALGTVLFTRSVKGLTPTAEALALGDAARAMARASAAFERTASAASGEVAGVVRLSVSEFVGVEVLPPMLAALRRRCPGLVFEVHLSNETANLLEQEVDVAVRMHPPRQEMLIARKVAAIPLGLFAHPDYLARRGEPATLEDLAAHDLIGPDRILPELALAARLFPHIDRNRFVLRTDSHPAQLAAARAGLGIAVSQLPVALRDGELRRVLPQFTVASLDAYVVTHENLRHLPRIRATVDHLAAAFRAFARPSAAASEGVGPAGR